MKDSPYFRQAQLMLRVMPHVAAQACFAVKGGTAINLFVRDMPRLSIDIDLTYLPLEPRDATLANIGEALQRIATAVRKTIPRATVQGVLTKGAEHFSKLTVGTAEATIKVEPNLVLRGTVYAPVERELCERAESLFDMSVTANTLSVADLYGGKICAALDRQHPRDLFEQEFAGMTDAEVGYEELVAVRERLVETIRNTMSENEKQFLVSIKRGQPHWDLVPVTGIEHLPAIQWKLVNIRRMDKKKQIDSLVKLEAALGL